MGRSQTKALLLDVGRQTFLERGYTNSGIETILQAANVPKGSFYYYFSSKEEFGLEVVDQFARTYDELMDQAFSDLALTPMQRFQSYFEQIIHRFDQGQCRQGCLIGCLSQELANQSESFRVKLEEIFQRWGLRYGECLSLAADAGEINPVLSIPDCVELWLSGWQGAMLRAKTAQSFAPLRCFLVIMLHQILRTTAPEPPLNRSIPCSRLASG